MSLSHEVSNLCMPQTYGVRSGVMLDAGRVQVSRSFRFPSGVSLTSLSWAPSSLYLRKCRMSYLVNSGGVTEKITWA